MIQLNRYELLKADIDNQMDVIQDNLTNMEGCFEILIPKNEFIEEDMDFDALLRGEVNSDQAMDDNYKDVRILMAQLFYIWTHLLVS